MLKSLFHERMNCLNELFNHVISRFIDTDCDLIGSAEFAPTDYRRNVCIDVPHVALKSWSSLTGLNSKKLTMTVLNSSFRCL
jgi:hypothetical protein